MQIRLSKALQHFISSLASEEARELVYEALLRQASHILALPPGPERAREIHDLVDMAIRDFGREKPEIEKAIRCHRGCGHCCRIWVGVTRDEAMLLAERVRNETPSIDLKRLRIQKEWTSPEDFIGKSPAEAQCVFLGQDGACRVYEDRPSVCRAVLMTSDPELCRNADCATQISAVINPAVELLVSSAQTADAAETGGQGSGPHARLLASGLWEALHP